MTQSTRWKQLHAEAFGKGPLPGRIRFGWFYREFVIKK
jgi:hypothetical protein